MAQQNPSTKWLEDRHNSGVVLSSSSIEVITLPVQAELDSATNSDPSIAACADFFMLDSFKDADSWAVDLTYSSVHGRLTLEVLQFISNVIMQGYKIPFFELSMLFFERKNTSACQPDIINPISVSNLRSGKQRLILDLRHVNQFIYKQKFKFEDFGHRYVIIWS